MNRCLQSVVVCIVLLSGMANSEGVPARNPRIGDITTVEGVRDNPVIGYGLVVGLNGTGDRRQTIFTTQMLANTLQRLGIAVSAPTVRVNNIAAVLVTAKLPPFGRPGTQIDVTVSSIGDAKSLEGGTLLLSQLRAADGQTYAVAQGAITLGGYSTSGGGNGKQVNHPTAGRIVAGGTIEKDTSIDLHDQPLVTLLLREADFETASRIAIAINREAGTTMASAVDGRRIDLKMKPGESIPAVLGRVQSLQVEAHTAARVVINERTGTVVIGKEVRLRAVSVLHGNLRISVATEFTASQPYPESSGQTTIVPNSELTAKEDTARRLDLNENATVNDLVNGLQVMGATARDVVAILQAIKAAGALDAEFEVL
jgi:flagellar P-ring protein FlgI